ncbi:hypothetical protein THMIRHAS_04680 [Thiosulfatimonas sediminis]|uniref:DUF4214 domain-containing protein n=1 Tax=Thiosulfatimonas sediminis TaxID=2675054 RepID=A0A6F8PSK0_9GAMM|nr:DUF4214 domain-containing protein [Thiosulfatimonas sediminis]BBP45095.1 hypothetical protein THMIRHAS_04680 [Thiosulfatimonas sediminis]
MALTTQQQAELISVYIAAFDRAPDADGLDFWAKSITDGVNPTVTDVSNAIFNDQTIPEVNANYSDALTNEQFVTKVYQNVFNREPDAEGLAFWAGAMNDGINSRGETVVEMFKSLSNPGSEADKALFDNKVAVGTYFAIDVGSNDVALAIQALDNVTADPASIDAAKAVIDGVDAIGQTFTLTEGADDFTPTSQQENSQTTVGDDQFYAGSVQGGGAHTLGSTDSIDGGDGTDTIRVVEDRDATATTLFPKMQNVENVELQALEDLTIDFTNTTGVEEAMNYQSVGNIVIQSLVDDADFKFFNTASDMSVGYFNNNDADNEADVMFDQANGSSITFTTATEADAIDTLNIELDNDTYTIDNAANTGFFGLNGTNNLDTINMMGNADVTVADLTGSLTQDITTFDASMLEGTLETNLLGNNLGINYDGAMGANTLVIGQGDNDITMQEAGDLVVLSSTGFDANDMMDGAGGTDRLEIHFNDTDAATDLDGNGLDTDVLDAINNTVNTEELVIDVWSQNTDDTAIAGENITLDRGLITSDFSTFIFDDTRTDGLGATNNVQDTDISGTVTVTNATAADDYQIAVDQVTTMSFTAAAGETTLNVTHNDADLVADMIGSFDSDVFTTTNLTVNAADENYMLGASQVDAGATLNLLGDADQMTANFGAEGDGATLDASTLVTTTDRNDGINNDFNVFTVTNGFDTTVKGTDQDDNIIGNAGVDTLHGNAGDDIIVGGAGDDTIEGGDGNDMIFAGDGTDAAQLEGVDKLYGNAGDDTFYFTYNADATLEGITSADMIDGGADNDTVQMLTAGAVLSDEIFNGFTSVEELTLAAGDNVVTINEIADSKVDFGTINAEGNGNDDINIGEGFDRELTINLGGGNDIVAADLSSANITVNIDAGNLDANDNLDFGDDAGDVLNIITENGIADTAGVTNLETLNIVDENGTNDLGQTTLVRIGDELFDNNTTPVDAFTVNAETVADDLVIDATDISGANIITINTGAGDDMIFGSANNDIINAGGNQTGGVNTIYGGAGADQIDASEGDNDITYGYVADSNGTRTEIDTVTGFVSGSDRIVLDTDMLAGNVLVAGSSMNAANFADAQSAVNNVPAGEIAYVFQTDDQILWVDINRDGTLNNDDLRINLDGVSAIEAGDVVNGDVYYDVDAAGNLLHVTAAAVPRAFEMNNDILGATIFVDGVDSGVTTFAAISPVPSAIDTLTVGGTTDISGAGVATFSSAAFEGGSNVTMTSAQHTAYVTPANASLFGVQTINITDAVTMTGDAAVENYALLSTAADNFTVASTTQNVDISAGGNDTVSISGTFSGTITGEAAGDIINLADGTNIAANATIASGNGETINVNGDATMTDAQYDAVVITDTVVTTNNLTITTAATNLAVDADIEEYTLNAGGVIAIANNLDVDINGAAGAAVTVVVGGATVASGAEYDLANGADIITVTDGADITNINDGAATTAESITVADNATVTMTAAQHTEITQAAGVETIIFDDRGGVDAVTADADVENYEIDGLGTDSSFVFTLSATGQNITSEGSTNTTVVFDGALGAFTSDLNDEIAETGDVIRVTNSGVGTTVDISGVLNSDDSDVALDLNNEFLTVTLTQEQHEAYSSVINTANGQTLDVDTAGAVTARVGVEAYIIDDEANSITVNAGQTDVNIDSDDASADTIIIGGNTVTGEYVIDATDTIEATDGANITGVSDGGAAGNATGGLLDLTGGITMTVAQLNDFTTNGITAAGAADAVTLTDAGTITSADAAIETFTLADGTNSITFDAADADRDLQTVNLGIGANTVIITNNATVDDGDDSAVTITNFGSDDVLTTGSSDGLFYNNFAGGATAVADGSIIEVDATQFQNGVLSNTANVLAWLNAETVTGAAGNALITVVAYTGNGSAGIYQLEETGGVAGAFDTIELIGVVNATDNVFVGANFA